MQQILAMHNRKDIEDYFFDIFVYFGEKIRHEDFMSNKYTERR